MCYGEVLEQNSSTLKLPVENVLLQKLIWTQIISF